MLRKLLEKGKLDRMEQTSNCLFSRRIHWGGTETATVWPGFMNGAVQAGTRAANEVLHKLYPNFIPVYQDKIVTHLKMSKYYGTNFWKVGIFGTVLVVAIFLAMDSWF